MAGSSSSPSRAWQGTHGLRAVHDLLESGARRPPLVIAAALLLSGTVFVLVTSKALTLLGGLVAVLGIGCAGPWVALAGTRGSIGFDRQRCRVGETVEAIVEVSGGFGRRRGLAFSDDALDPPPVTLVGTPDRITLVPGRRGLFPRVPPRIESDVPFGLVVARRPLRIARRVVVWPVTVPIRFPAALVDPRRHGRESSDCVAGSSGDVLGVREYRAGDVARSIHWAQTARRDAVMVCERPGDGGPTVRLLVDRVVAPSATAPGAALEAIVALTASMLESWVPRGIRMEVAWAGGAVLRAAGRRGLEAALDAVACLEPCWITAEATVCHPTDGARPHLSLRHLRPADLDVWLTTPPRREAFATAVSHGLGRWAGGTAGSGRAGGIPRLMLVVDSAAGAPSRVAAPAGSRGDLEIVLPATAAAAHLDRVLGEIGHDPDALRA